MQAQAAATEVAGGLRDVSECSRSDVEPGSFTVSRPGSAVKEEEEENFHRQHSAGGAGESLQLQPQADQRGGSVHLGRSLPGEGGCSGLVLQQTSEGEKTESQQQRQSGQFSHPRDELNLILSELLDPHPSPITDPHRQPPLPLSSTLYVRYW